MTYRLSDSHEIQQASQWLSQNWGQTSRIEYYSARSIDEAVGLLREFGKDAKMVAGGTDFLGLLKCKVISPKVLINIKNIPGLRYIQESEKGLAIGAMTLINDIERSELLKSQYPVLYETACAMASPQIRNMATLGGNVCQEVRCWYYRRPPDTGIVFNCRRKVETSPCFAADGENQYHAIMGTYPCRAICGSDMATVLLALDARLQTVSADGGRLLRVDELYTPLGLTLVPGEVVTAIQIPRLNPETRQHFLKFRVRKAIDFAIVSAAAILTLEENRVKNARVVVGGVTYKPFRSIKAEELLKGKQITEILAAEAGKAALSEAVPLSKNGYKVTLAETMVKRAILE